MTDDEDVSVYGGFGPRSDWDARPKRLAASEHLAGTGLLATTPQCDDDADDHAEATPLAIEGPFYKFASPQRWDFRQPGETGQIVELTGRILNRSNQPMAGTAVDLWHANKFGEYDNAGFRYRGHVITNADGRYRFMTIKPGAYGNWGDGTGRTVHYHVIVRAPKVWRLTTQLYFPNEADNLRDDYFRKDLLMQVQPQGEGFSAQFDIVLETFRTS